MSMMVDSGSAAGNGDESHHLLTHDSSFFNDLTYSDDDEMDEFWEGVSGSLSSPETAALLAGIQDAIFTAQQPPQQQQQQQQQQQLHLMHPLARHESAQSDCTDDASYLAYSIGSSHIDEESRAGATSMVSPSGATISSSTSPTKSYGSMENASFKPSFRPPSSVFDHSSRSSTNGNAAKSTTTKSSKKKYSRQNTPPKKTKTSKSSSKPKPKPSTNRNNSSIETHSSSLPMVDTEGCYTPYPGLSESPVTSATATDDTHSPLNGTDTSARTLLDYPPTHDNDNDFSDDPQQTKKERIAQLLGAEATKRVRRHKRLKRIKKAAEAREAAVQKVRGTIQPNQGCNDAIFAFLFLCQFLLVSMSAVAFGPWGLRDKIYGEIFGYDGTEGGAGGEEGRGADYNPFAGLQTDDVIIVDNPLLNKVIDGGSGAYGGGSTAGGAATTTAYVEEDTIHDYGISHIDYINVIQLVCITSGYASLCSLMALWFMMMLSKNLLHATLVFTIVVCMAWTLLGLALDAKYVVSLAGAVALALSFLYTCVVWDRIPFAATNLGVALKGMKSTLDVPFVGVCVLATTFLWTIWWICAFVGTFDFLNDDEELSNNWMCVVVVFFGFSYYWTLQVIKGISQFTVASVIGKWWDMSEEEPLPMCSSVLHATLTRNIIGSFGSICLGSLIVGPCILLTRISTFSSLARPKLNWWKTKSQPVDAAPQDGKCAREILNKNDDSCSPHANDGGVISRHVNQWSFTYVGLYGYKFWDSGSKASQLFEARGWTHVVSDDLIMTVMAMSSMIIGGTTACLGLIVEEVDGYSLTSLNEPIATAFLIGLFVGYFLSSAFLSIIEGSVSAILVCYAARPVEFHANHHKLSEEMKSAWKHFWLQKPNNGK